MCYQGGWLPTATPVPTTRRPHCAGGAPTCPPCSPAVSCGSSGARLSGTELGETVRRRWDPWAAQARPCCRIQVHDRSRSTKRSFLLRREVNIVNTPEGGEAAVVWARVCVCDTLHSRWRGRGPRDGLVAIHPGKPLQLGTEGPPGALLTRAG